MRIKEKKLSKWRAIMLVFTMVAVVMAFGGIKTAQAATTVISAEQISDESKRAYVNKAIAYYLHNDVEVMQAVGSGLSAVFVFEGASNNAQTYEMYVAGNNDVSLFDTRTSAICVVVKNDESGQPNIVYFNDNSSSLPSDPYRKTSEGMPATTKDGVYQLISWNHQGRYAALQVHDKDSAYVPILRMVNGTNDYNVNAKTTNGINLHTRGNQKNSSNWSTGCILIDSYDNIISGKSTTKVYEDFLASVYPIAVDLSYRKDTDQGVTYRLSGNPDSDYYKVFLPRISSGTEVDVGVLVLDRSLYEKEMDIIYKNSEAVDIILESSKSNYVSIMSYGMTQAEKNSTITRMTSSMSTSEIRRGEDFFISGTIVSTWKICKIEAAILDRNGIEIDSHVFECDQTTISLESLPFNSNLAFKSLSEGQYVLRIKAINIIGGVKAMSPMFYIIPAASILDISFDTSDKTITMGKDLIIEGLITSNYPIYSVKGYIMTDGYSALQQTSSTPYIDYLTFDDALINAGLDFSILEPGTYIFMIEAGDVMGGSVMRAKRIIVERGPSTLTVSPTMSTKTIEWGDSCDISGTVESNYMITSVVGKILNSSGSEEMVVTVVPNSTELDLGSSRINKELNFGLLGYGNYTLQITASDAYGKTVIHSIPFTVCERSTLAMDMYLGNAVINQGSACAVYGTVSGNYKITNITGTIKTPAGIAKQTVTINPNSTFVNLAGTNINYGLSFGSLSAGTYTVTVTATDEIGNAVSVTKNITINAVAASLKISAYMDTTTINWGNSCNIRGTVTSNYTISSVVGYIFDSNGTIQQVITIVPNAKTVDLASSRINKELMFGKLGYGNYTLRIKATDTSSNTVQEDIAFVVK